ncbi:Wzz/FepE/Etk N-terminal domain-containing protein [Glycomyces luteolus]|uniref:Wzz/FepE/Etk N-terminal domain-containing protein n=1 Tax=Glycomyces luteolus TaxID=2670330 RepID=A0A9X3SR42_9ACTN|nr:Wzz/FepE/Etk N-terminal domain-containing protein [Glycomyces luteolus]MDA1360881.1 Wzz/FepE/Etk N-terminal domain-containing protein [Glycomyces luteolus]
MRTPAARTLADYGVIVRRSWWLIIGTVAAALAGGFAYTSLSEEVYESTSSILVLPTASDTAVAGARTAGQVNLDTEAQLVKSTEVAAAAAEALGSDDPDGLVSRVSVTVPPNTAVLEIAYRAGDPKAAQAGAIAFSEAYLEHRRSGATASVDSAIAGATAALKGVKADIAAAEDELSQMYSGENGRSAIESELDGLRQDAEELEAQIAELDAQLGAISPGRVINQASVPGTPVSPNAMFNLAAALGLGLPLGLILAWARHRLARKVAYPTDLVERCELDVLASVPPAVKFQRREVFGAYSPGGRVFSQLRNVVASQLTHHQRVIVVAGVAPGPAASVVAANLATAMARAGDRVTAVAANPSTTVGLPELFGTDSVPGLADVWSGRVDLGVATHAAPRQPSLSVIGPGAAARAAGPTSEAAAETFSKLAEAGRFVVVDAPPLSCSADAQLLAGHADAVILAVQSGRDAIGETAAAALAMRQIDTPLLGAVLLPSGLGPMNTVPLPTARREAPAPGEVSQDETPTDSLEPVEDGAVERKALMNSQEATTQVMPVVPAAFPSAESR